MSFQGTKFFSYPDARVWAREKKTKPSEDREGKTARKTPFPKKNKKPEVISQPHFIPKFQN
jgi:hypothetical protein